MNRIDESLTKAFETTVKNKGIRIGMNAVVEVDEPMAMGGGIEGAFAKENTVFGENSISKLYELVKKSKKLRNDVLQVLLFRIADS